ncbi:unnamed protein product [Urochloa humidicola]
MHARLASQSLRCAQFCLADFEELAVVDAPSLERLFIWQCLGQRRGGRIKIHIGHVPQLNMLGYSKPVMHLLEIGNTIIKSGTRPSPKTTVPSVRCWRCTCISESGMKLRFLQVSSDAFPMLKHCVSGR